MLKQVEGADRALGTCLEAALDAFCMEKMKAEERKDSIAWLDVIVADGALAWLALIGAFDKVRQ